MLPVVQVLGDGQAGGLGHMDVAAGVKHIIPVPPFYHGRGPGLAVVKPARRRGDGDGLDLPVNQVVGHRVADGVHRNLPPWVAGGDPVVKHVHTAVLFYHAVVRHAHARLGEKAVKGQAALLHLLQVALRPVQHPLGGGIEPGAVHSASWPCAVVEHQGAVHQRLNDSHGFFPFPVRIEPEGVQPGAQAHIAFVKIHTVCLLSIKKNGAL